jgi:rhamnosyltransferase subunit B
MDIIFESLGTVGDVAPIVAVAQELQRRGHTCELLTNEIFVADARRAGLRAQAVSTQYGILRRMPRFDDYLYCAYLSICEHFLRRARPQLVVNCDRYCTSNLLAERYGLPVVRLHLSPFKLRPYDTRRVPSYDLFARNERVLAYVNQLRSRLGLAAVGSAFHAEPHVVRHVATFPRWLCREPLEGAPELDFVGFPLPAENGPLPAELRGFIERYGRPIVFTYGTANDELGEFIRQADLCCWALQVPGVVLCPRGVGNLRASEQLLLCPFTPLGALLPESRLLVHHGGIGTAARALEAGVPQVIIPQRFDQPDNGERIAALGVGRVIDQGEFSANSMATTIRPLLACEALARRSDELRARVRRENAIEQWADILEKENFDAVA